MTNKPKNQTLTIDQWVEQFTSHIAFETSNLFDFENKTPELSRKLLSHYLAYFIQDSVYLSLANERNSNIKTDEEENRAVAEFNAFKMAIQDGVAEGFRTAMLKFTGKNLDYYCMIQPVGPAINREPC